MNRLFSLLHSDPRMYLTLNDLAAKMLLSPAAASRLFRKAAGENFTEYRRRTRLDYVKKELETTRKSITKIAVEIGFTSSSVFNRVFREEYGATPSQYREQYRQAGPVERASRGKESGKGPQDIFIGQHSARAGKSPIRYTHSLEAVGKQNPQRRPYLIICRTVVFGARLLKQEGVSRKMVRGPPVSRKAPIETEVVLRG